MKKTFCALIALCSVFAWGQQSTGIHSVDASATGTLSAVCPFVYSSPPPNSVLPVGGMAGLNTCALTVSSGFNSSGTVLAFDVSQDGVSWFPTDAYYRTQTSTGLTHSMTVAGGLGGPVSIKCSMCGQPWFRTRLVSMGGSDAPVIIEMATASLSIVNVFDTVPLQVFDSALATQLAAGIPVSVGNFPASFQVSNFPVTQAVTWTGNLGVTVSNFPATQPVSVSGTVSVAETTPISYNYKNFSANTTGTLVDPNPGTIGEVDILTPGTVSSCSFYDGTSTSGTPMGTISTLIGGPYVTLRGAHFNTALFMTATSTLPANITVLYK